MLGTLSVKGKHSVYSYQENKIIPFKTMGNEIAGIKKPRLVAAVFTGPSSPG